MPTIVAVFAIPELLSRLGPEEFAVLSLLWVLLAYFEFFDLGVSRALTKHLADSAARSEPQSDADLTVSALLVVFLFSMFCSPIAFALTGGLAEELVALPESLRAQAATSLQLAAWALPIVAVSTCLRGALEARSRFGLVACIRVPTTTLNFAAPLAILSMTTASLDDLVSAVLVVRGATLLAYVTVSVTLTPELTRARPSCALMRTLLAYGGWIAISNILGPTMLYADRFLVSSILPMSVVVFYNTPLEVLTKLLVVPAAIVAVAFPAFAAAPTNSSAAPILRRMIGLQALFVGPVCIALAVFSYPLMSVWIDPTFADQSRIIVALIAAGLFFASNATILQSFIQARGRPDFTTKLQLMELPLYLSYLWFCTRNYGIEGTALAWSLRYFIGLTCLGVLARTLRNQPTAA